MLKTLFGIYWILFAIFIAFKNMHVFKILILILVRAWGIFSASFLAGRPGNRAAIAGRVGATLKRVLL